MGIIGSGWRQWRRKGAVFAAAMWIGAAALAQDIVVGQIGPFTVLPVPDAKEINEGVRAHFAQVNARGGIHGRKLSLFELDDQYAPDMFVQRFEEAMQRRPVALLSPVGSAAIKRMLDERLLDGADVVVLNAVPGAESLRSPGHPKLFHIRAGDRQQIEKIVRHARTLGMTRMAVLHQDIPIGVSGLEMAKVAGQEGQMQVAGFQSTAEEASLAEAARQVAAAGAHSVLVVGSPKYMADGLSQLRRAGVRQSVFTLSYMPAGLAAKVAGESAARGVGIAQTYPNPMGVSLPLHREFQAAMKAAHPKLTGYTAFHLEGYLTARLLSEALQRSREATPEALARALRGQGEWDLGGFKVDFAKGNTGSQYVDIGVVTTGGRLMY